MTKDIAFLIFGFVLLIQGAHYLVDGSIHLARRFKVSDWLIGITVVAFGGSLPELMVNIKAILAGSSDIAVSNVLGSNTTNICLVLALAATIYPLDFHKRIIKFELPVVLLSIAIIGTLLFIGGPVMTEAHGLSKFEGLFLLVAFALFIYGITRTDIPAAEDHHPNQQIAITLVFHYYRLSRSFFLELDGLWIPASRLPVNWGCRKPLSDLPSLP